MKNILYYNNCWMTNIGEAFIDIGACKLLQNIPNLNIIANSSMTEWYLQDFRKKVRTGSLYNKIIGPRLSKEINLSNCFKLQDYYKPDYLILSGMMASEALEKSETFYAIQAFREKGTEIIFLGLGGEHYTIQEKEYFSHFLEKLSPKLVITRDHKTYDAYKNVSECYDGIDCALWTSEVYNPVNFPTAEYFCLTFNRSKEPPLKELGLHDTDRLVRPIHSLYGTNPRSSCLKADHVFLTDSPVDYLSLYANAKAVYTDMVHATLVSLMYETPVKYFYFDHRSEVIYSLPTSESNGLLQLDMDAFEKKKREIEAILCKYIC